MSNNLINSDNYESVFFKLLENEYDRNERKAILEEISNNPFYSFEWECWQKTQLKDESKELAFTYKSFFDDIKSEADLFVVQPKKRMLPLYWKISAIAACLFIALTFTFILNTNNTDIKVISNNNSSKEIEKKLPKYLSIDSIKPNDVKIKLSDKMERFTIINTDLFLQKEPGDSFLIIKKDTVSEIIVKQIEVPIVIDPDSNRIIPKIAVVQIPVYKRKFTVSPEKAIKPELIVKLSDLEASNTNIIKFFDNKRITVVRKNKKLYLRLIEENESTILLSLK